MKSKGSAFRSRVLLALLVLILVAAYVLTAQPREPAPMVFAAASLSELLQEWGENYRLHTGKRVEFHFHSSAVLKMQIDHGAGADLFISASPVEVNALEPGRVMTRANLLGNRLVLFEKDSRPGWRERIEAGGDTLRRAEVRRVAIGDPGHVPAGRYAREALEAMGIWEGLEDRLVRAIHVRQVIEYVRRGEADLGIAYRTDVQGTRGLRVLWVFPEESHSPIIYVGAVVRGGEHPDLAGQFLRYLTRPERRGTSREYGFLTE